MKELSEIDLDYIEVAKSIFDQFIFIGDTESKDKIFVNFCMGLKKITQIGEFKNENLIADKRPIGENLTFIITNRIKRNHIYIGYAFRRTEDTHFSYGIFKEHKPYPETIGTVPHLMRVLEASICLINTLLENNTNKVFITTGSYYTPVDGQLEYQKGPEVLFEAVSSTYRLEIFQALCKLFHIEIKFPTLINKLE